MSRKLLLAILNGVRAHDDYFTTLPDVTGKLGFTSYQKYSTAICMLAYGVAGGEARESGGVDEGCSGIWIGRLKTGG
jgi:hypothetical protein